jgi:hypothetical protein
MVSSSFALVIVAITEEFRTVPKCRQEKSLLSVTIFLDAYFELCDYGHVQYRKRRPQMNADEIRKATNWGTLTQENEGTINVLLEIAAQLAELNEKMERLITVGSDISGVR